MLIKKIVIFNFLRILLSFLFCFDFLESSIINVDLNSNMPGFEDFQKGREYFEKENFDQAVYCFVQAIEKSYKPSFYCEDYWNEDYSACIDWDDIDSDDVSGLFVVSDFLPEIYYAVNRHSHFYLGLINLYLQEYSKAHIHFKEAIGFSGEESEMGSLFFICMNIIDPSWYIYTAHTSLYLGDLNLAQWLVGMSLNTTRTLNDILLDSYHWKDKVYWKDLQEREITGQAWSYAQEIMAYNTQAIITGQNDLPEAIQKITYAIRIKDYAIQKGIFSSENPENFVLYSNRGSFYFKIGDYQSALADFTKSIELKPLIADNYFK